MNILLLGSGGREHALAWKLRQSPQTEKLFIAPGNAGTDKEGINAAIGVTDFAAIGAFALAKAIDRVVVGPEEPLARGLYDFFKNDPKLRHIPVIGPSKKGAQLESSKSFAKAFMERHHIPTARYRSVSQPEEGFAFLETLPPPYVLKADGLAGGKGVAIIDSLDEAKRELREILAGKFGDAGKTAVIEEFLNGIECSVFVLTDGNHYKILPAAKDYKRVGEGNTGLNTGGMGAVSPVPFADAGFMKKTEERIVRPTMEGLKAEGIDYKGFLFLGLMNVEGDPFVIEYNCRLGDPETEAVMLRLRNDLVELLEGIVAGNLDRQVLAEDPRAAATVMLVSGGYPGSYGTGKRITGLDKAVADGTVVFHAGTRRAGNDIVTSGGRVLAVSAYGSGRAEALANCYRAASAISFDGMYFRSDIGFDL
jgi:phosphoribosylamine--glycine ligase